MKPKNLTADTEVRSTSTPMRSAQASTLQTAGLLLLSAVTLSLAFAPFKQFYFAWVGLAPFFLVVRSLGSQRSAFLWGWATGILFFFIGMGWLAHVTPAGAGALIVYLGLFWGLAAMTIRGSALLGRWDSGIRQTRPPKRPLRCAILVAAMWCGFEWLRGSYSPFGAHGLPLLFVGASQTPILPVCQIADITGVYGVSFWVVLINALVAMLWIDRANLKRLRHAVLAVAGLLMAVTGYGLFRTHEQTRRPGPTVMVVQCNYPQSNTGEKGAPMEAIAEFYVRTTQSALTECQQRGQNVDLVVWSETMIPPLNQAARIYLRGIPYGNFIEQTSQRISGIADQFRTSLLIGSTYAADWQWVAHPGGEAKPLPMDRRNSAYMYGPAGLMEADRYDKIQLLPFGEFVPFRDSIPWLYRMLLSLGPPYMKEYELTPGAPDALTVFHLDQMNLPDLAAAEPVVATQAWRFVVPICFEDLVAPLVDDLMWGTHGKRADFIVNITNDGWFRGGERAQHLQDAIFRSIEHRVPAARSVNTGISGFIDSDGEVTDTIAAGTQGWSLRQLQLDNRTTLYSRLGDAFAQLCALVTIAIVGYGIVFKVKRRRSARVNL